MSNKRDKRKKRAKKMQRQIDPVVRLCFAVKPLLELFSVVNDVFEEPDAFDPARMQAGMGRIYRAWKACRESLDPSFDRKRYKHQKRT